MCYYDRDNNYMYVISVGHLFDGLSYRRGKNTAVLEVFYMGDRRLARPKVYTAEVLAWAFTHDTQNAQAYDVSLLRFRPDWPNPRYSPIAPKNYKLEYGKYYHSMGCDQPTPRMMSSDPAHYLVQFWKEESIGNGMTQVRTVRDAPRGGRSGGGALTEDGYLVFMCSRRHGDGDGGVWTSLSQIYRFLETNNYRFVADDIPARRKRIVDLDDPKRECPREFILVPSGIKR